MFYSLIVFNTRVRWYYRKQQTKDFKMKGLFIFTVMVLAYSMVNMVHHRASAGTYKQGIEAFLKHQGHVSNVKRSPAIIPNK
jgi:hypothetical protein